MVKAKGDAMGKAHRILNKSEIMQMDYVNFMLEAAASSAGFGTIEEWQPNGKFYTRANINASLVMPFGSGKTTSLVKVPDCISANDMTFAGMIGTISKEGMFCPGSILKAAGKLLLIDEFQKLSDGVKDAMNSLLEPPHRYSRNLGYSIKHPVRRSGKNYRLVVKEGSIELECKFSCIVGGMHMGRENSTQRAWDSRFIPIIFTPELDFYKRLTLGERTIRINPRHFEGDFKFKDYPEFHRKYWSEIEKNPYFMGFFAQKPWNLGYSARNLQDTVRVAAFIASLSGRQLIRREDWESSLRFISVMMTNRIFSGLTDVQIAILSNPDKSSLELSNITGTSESNISQRRNELKEIGLLLEKS